MHKAVNDGIPKTALLCPVRFFSFQTNIWLHKIGMKKNWNDENKLCLTAATGLIKIKIK